MKRRDFILKTAAGGALLSFGGLSLSSFNEENLKHLTILHTNDTHSHFEPLKADHYAYPGRGGIARRAALVDRIRKENPNTFLFDAGDIFQGTPYFNFFGGEVEFKLMSKLRYDASTIGNHDFDNGIEGLHKQLPHAKFDFITANYDFSNTVMNGKTIPYKIFNKAGLKIGVFGLGVNPEGLVDPLNVKEMKYLDPVGIAQDMSRILKEEKHCDLVICLSHLGYYYKRNPDKISDLNLAKQTKNIDLIIGGHTHTFLPKPTIVKNSAGENMLINQVGKWGLNLGRVDFYFDDAKNISAKGKSIIV